MPGLVALMIFVALGVSEARVSEPTLGPAPTTSVRPASSSQTRSKAPPGRLPPPKHAASTNDGVPLQARAAVERDVLSRVLTSPAGKIPSALIDASTGLAKNNLQASCRATAPRTFVCTVRPVTHEDREGLTVRYRQTRRGPAEVTWGRYRRR